MIIQPVSFGAKSILRTEFDRGNIPLKRDITGHKLKRGESSLDHTIPKSKGGKSDLYNYTLMNPIANNKRGSNPIKQYIDLESLVEYLYIMLNVKTMDLDGVDYVKGLLKNLLRAIKEGK